MHVTRAFIVGIACALWASLAGAAPRLDHDRAEPELLLFDPVPMVITATRTEKSLLDVPNAATVITAADIRASGATTLPELLRWVPGLEFMRVSAADLNVSSRGFNSTSSSQMLVMIDGRTTYADFFGVVLWDQLNVAVQDIERIEVIRGPGSALYGANAFLGTINIITRDARELPRVQLRLGAGTRGSTASITAAGSRDRLSMKGTAHFESHGAFRNERNTAANTDRRRDDTARRGQRFNGTVEYELSDDSRLAVSAGLARQRGDLLTDVATFDFEGPSYYLKLNLDRGPWRFQTFVQHLDLDIVGLPTGLPVGTPIEVLDRIRSTTFDVESQREIHFGSHELLVGLNVRRLTTDAPMVLGARESETLYAGFAQDEYAVNDWLTAYLGARLDDHPKTGLSISPRAGLVADLGENRRLRLSIARSFRNPTQILNYSSLTLFSSIAGTPTPLVQVQGTDDVDPVWVTAYELGYQTALGARTRGRVDLFYNVMEDFPVFQAIAAGPPTVLSWVNQGRTSIWGGELALDVRLYDSMSGFASYSFQSAHGPNEGASPTHKGSAGLRGQLGSRWRYALSAAIVGHTRTEKVQLTPFPDRTIPSHASVDAFLGFAPADGLEIGIQAKNVLHQTRRRYPYGDELGSEVLVTASWEF